MTDLTLPQLSISMEEGKVLQWLVEDGTEVQAGDVIVEVETDKATVEVEAPASGRLQIVAEPGSIVPVDGLLARIDDGSPDDVSVLAPRRGDGAVDGAEPEAKPAAPSAPAPTAGAGEQPGRTRIAASPAARRVARELGVDLAGIAGSGPGGRILVRDVERAARAAPAPSGEPVASVPQPGEAVTSAPQAGEQVTTSDLRSIVVASLAASWREIPHINIVGELAAEGLAEAKRLAAGRPGPRVTVTDLLLLAVARALTDVPDLNGTVGPDARPVRSTTVNLALAIATPEGVVAPVIRDAAGESLQGIARERARLVEAARAGALDKRDLGGATCTLSNLGAYPVDLFTPVVTSPQIALIAVGRLADRPVAIDGMLAVRPRLWVNAAIDHRGADGEAGGRFLAALERRLAALPEHV